MTDIRRQLHHIAEQHFRGERSGHTLQPTAIANEVWIRLLAQDELHFEHPAAFKAWASMAVRHILVDHARRKMAKKRGGDRTRVALTDQAAADDIDVLALNDALEALQDAHERSARVVEMRFFGGMTDAEIAAELGVSDRTVRNDWRFARGWLRDALAEDQKAP
ncbi:ECF-type sigma factor [Pyruvatibacter sp.]|uniref:ECF-type sigma factor n=1 Tax=Pyruvatibacter sp. TaxID=1981328 RepID=UPI0032EB04B9